MRVGNDSCSSSRPNSEDGLLFLPPPQDDLSILLRKMGTSADPHTKKAAIIGDITCFSFVQPLCLTSPNMLRQGQCLFSASSGGWTSGNFALVTQRFCQYGQMVGTRFSPRILQFSYVNHTWNISTF